MAFPWKAATLLSLTSTLINIPLGYYRTKSEKYSIQWVLWIHASVPVIIALRKLASMPKAVIPMNIAAAIAGQMIGGSEPVRTYLDEKTNAKQPGT